MTQISKEYAKSLFALASEDRSEEKYLEELNYFYGISKSEPEYAELLSSPALTREERVALLDEAFEGKLSEYVMSFLKLLCESGEMKLIGECIEEYEKMYRDSMRRHAVKVTSAVELNGDEKERIERKTEKIVGGICDVTYVVDPSILGGVIIETENALIDGSLKKSLQEVKEVIKK